MRKLTLGMANSLDNYIARKDGGFDWLHWSKEVAEISAKFMRSVDAILIGRKTYEVMRAYGQTCYPGGKNYVFSHRMKTIRALESSFKKRSQGEKSLAKKADGDVRFVAGDAAGFVRKLKREKGKGICLFGGGELAKSLFEADLIDEVVLNIHPVLLGSGISLFHEMRRQINLELLDCQILEGGCLAVSYRVKH